MNVGTNASNRLLWPWDGQTPGQQILNISNSAALNINYGNKH
jgi:hypothetical protein